MRLLRPLSASLLALLLLLVQAGAAVAEQTITLQLTPIAGSGVSGTAVATALDDTATLTLSVTGLAPGATVQGVIRSGTCDRPSASFGLLGTLTADAGGRATLTTTSARVSAAGVPTDLTLIQVARGNVAIQGLACGQGPEAAVSEAAPARLPTAGGPAFLLAASTLGVLGAFSLAGGLLLRRRS